MPIDLFHVTEDHPRNTVKSSSPIETTRKHIAPSFMYLSKQPSCSSVTTSLIIFFFIRMLCIEQHHGRIHQHPLKSGCACFAKQQMNCPLFRSYGLSTRIGSGVFYNRNPLFLIELASRADHSFKIFSRCPGPAPQLTPYCMYPCSVATFSNLLIVTAPIPGILMSAAARKSFVFFPPGPTSFRC